MKTKNLLIAISMAMLSTPAAHAQKVEPNLIDGKYPVINCEGIPPATYTTKTKGTTQKTLETAGANKTVYKRFAVYNTDNKTSSPWLEAFAACSSISDGKTWRLPTQRELLLMWLLKSELESKNGFTKFINAYWSATERTSFSESWKVVFTGSDVGTTGDTDPGVTNDSGGGVSANSRLELNNVRCIREL